MKYERYPVRAYDSFRRFEFYSKGPKGRIAKVVAFRPTYPRSTIYNLGFGDLRNDDEFDDEVVTNNGDTSKVLATVSHSVLKFLKRYPARSVYIIGSTPARARLYRITISNSIDFLPGKFRILGRLGGGDWCPFQSAIEYDAFNIKLKK